MSRYSIRLSYNGSDYSGWQIQNNSISVQEVLQRALTIAFGKEMKVTGAGRTDTKVNAINYVAHFDSDEPPVATDATGLVYKLNAILPPDIRVHEVTRTGNDFHSRFSATSRKYHYFMHLKKDPFMGRFSYFCRYNLDVGMMNEAAAFLLGTHDFRCFEKTGGNNKTSICTVYEARWENYVPTHVSMMGYPAGKEDYLVFTIRADRFLRNMVRAVVGTSIDIGRGKHAPEWMKSLMETGSRSDAGESVPGNALFLSEVSY